MTLSTQKKLAGAFIDNILSPGGQAVAKDAAYYFSENWPLPPSVTGPPAIMESGVGRPIRIGPALLAAQDRAQRDRFIADWTKLLRQTPKTSQSPRETR
ncbi:Extracellular solute-binding protein family 1 (fragment) [Agrobacterium fabacearum S56]